MVTMAVALGMVFSAGVLAQEEDQSDESRTECETAGGTWIEDWEADGELFRYAEDMANESGEPPGYEYLRGIAGRDFCARTDPDWPQQKTECQADGGTWIEVYEGIGRPAGWFEDPYLPGWCVTAEELEQATPAGQEMESGSVESGPTQTEPPAPPPSAPTAGLPATQPAQAQQSSPQYTG